MKVLPGGNFTSPIRSSRSDNFRGGEVNFRKIIPKKQHSICNFHEDGLSCLREKMERS